MATYSALAQTMLGQNPQFALPANYTFDDLAAYEEMRRKGLIPQLQEQMAKLKTGLQSQYGDVLNRYKTTTAGRRSSLSSSLADTATKQFQLQNPALLEDLNARGLASSPSEVARAQAQVQKELALENDRQLNEFDFQTRGYEDALEAQRLQDLNEIEKANTAGGLQIEQDALDSGLDLRRGQLESSLQQSQAAQEQALAERLAKQQGRQGLTQSLIGAGGGILGGLLAGGGGGLFGGGGTAGGGGLLSSLPLFGGGGIGAGAGLSGYAPSAGAASSLFPGGVGAAGAAPAGGIGLGGLGLLAGGGIGASLLSRAGEKKGGTLGGVLANPIGYQINKAKQIISDPKKVVGNVAKSVAKPVQSAVRSVSSSIKKAFCFDAETPIEMKDGSKRSISKLYIGAETKGGKVNSIRVSIAEDGSRFNYKGVYVTGSHAVYEEGKWTRVKDSKHAKFVDGDGIVWSLATEDHKIYVDDILFSDELETDDYEQLTIDQSLDELNLRENLAEASNGF